MVDVNNCFCWVKGGTFIVFAINFASSIINCAFVDIYASFVVFFQLEASWTRALVRAGGVFASVGTTTPVKFALVNFLAYTLIRA